MNKFAIISGTNRANSRSLKIANRLNEIYIELGADAKLIDLAQLPADIYNPNIYTEKPESFLPWSQAILESIGLVVVVPEYNGSFPGILKYFIDLLPFPESFENRPVCFVGLAAGGWGALRAVEHLQGVFGYRNAHIFPKRVFLPLVGRELDESGEVNADLCGRLRAQAEGFIPYAKTFAR